MIAVLQNLRQLEINMLKYILINMFIFNIKTFRYFTN